MHWCGLILFGIKWQMGIQWPCCLSSTKGANNAYPIQIGMLQSWMVSAKWNGFCKISIKEDPWACLFLCELLYISVHAASAKPSCFSDLILLAKGVGEGRPTTGNKTIFKSMHSTYVKIDLPALNPAAALFYNTTDLYLLYIFLINCFNWFLMFLVFLIFWLSIALNVGKQYINLFK